MNTQTMEVNIKLDSDSSATESSIVEDDQCAYRLSFATDISANWTEKDKVPYKLKKKKEGYDAKYCLYHKMSMAAYEGLCIKLAPAKPKYKYLVLVGCDTFPNFTGSVTYGVAGWTNYSKWAILPITGKGPSIIVNIKPGVQNILF